MKIAQAILICLLTVPAFAADHFIRDGATGSSPCNSDGWNATSACDQFPATLVRGDTYWVADGTYSAYVFDDAESGTTVITIKKATIADHGTATGWLDSYGDGQAVIDAGAVAGAPAWDFQTGYWTVDGNGALGTYGFKFINALSDDPSFPPQGMLIAIGEDIAPSIDGMIMRSLELDPDHIKAVNGININRADNCLFANIAIHDTDDDGFVTDTVTNCIFEYLHVYDRIAAAGTVAHPDVFEIWGGGDNTVRYSHFEWAHAVNTVIVFTFNERNSGRWDIYGNIFDGLGLALSKAIISSSGFTYGPLNIYNNTFARLQFATGLPGNESGQFRNNLCYNSEAANLSSLTHDYNWYFGCTTQSETNIQNGSGDPFVNLAAKDFHLAAATNAGDTTIGATYNTDDIDDAGITRGADGVWDRGAHEFVAGGQPLDITTLTVPNGTVGIPYLADIDAGGGTAPYTFTLLSGTLPTGTFLASENKASTANLLSDSGNFATAEPPANLWDGCLSATDDCMTGNTGISSFFVEFDFGASCNLKGARLFGDNAGVWVSSTWKLEHKVLVGDSYTTAFTGADAFAAAWFLKALSVSARFVKVTVSSTTGSTEARELEIYCEDSTSPSGVITGSPSAAGTFNFTIRATDSATPTPATDDQAYSSVIIGVVGITSTSPLPGAFVGVLYSFTFGAEGGATPYVWTRTSGTWPAGLDMSTAGVLSGTPTTVESQSVGVTVTDNNLDTDVETFSIEVFDTGPRRCCRKNRSD